MKSNMLYGLESDLYPSVAEANRLMPRIGTAMPVKLDWFAVVTVAAMVALSLIHFVSDVNTTTMILNWLKRVL